MQAYTVSGGLNINWNNFEITQDDTLEDDEELVESDVEFDTSDVVQPDSDLPCEMGDPSAVVTDEDLQAAKLSKSRAMDAVLEGNLDQAINHLTVAIILTPKSELLYASRASVFVKLKKPVAALRDANAALQINPYSAKGYKARGMANTLLGSWEAATMDLREASDLDFDEETSVKLKMVEPYARKLEEHRKKYERLRMEREIRLAQWTTGRVIEIESAAEISIKFRAAYKSSRQLVLYFSATWCPPCGLLDPGYTSLAEKYPEVVFLKVNIAKAKDVTPRWKIFGIPSFCLIGKKVEIITDRDLDLVEKTIVQPLCD